jgi:hypothetical protein
VSCIAIEHTQSSLILIKLTAQALFCANASALHCT